LVKVLDAITTTNAYAASRRLTWDREHKQIIFEIENGHAANGIHYKIMASMAGSAKEYTLKAETLLASSTTMTPETLTDRYDTVWVEVKSAVANTPSNAVNAWITGTKS
jgi:hypothetical protein